MVRTRTKNTEKGTVMRRWIQEHREQHKANERWAWTFNAATSSRGKDFASRHPPVRRWWSPSLSSWSSPASFPCPSPESAGTLRPTGYDLTTPTPRNRPAWIGRCCRWTTTRPVPLRLGSTRRRSARSDRRELGRRGARSSDRRRAIPSICRRWGWWRPTRSSRSTGRCPHAFARRRPRIQSSRRGPSRRCWSAPWSRRSCRRRHHRTDLHGTTEDYDTRNSSLLVICLLRKGSYINRNTQTKYSIVIHFIQWLLPKEMFLKYQLLFPNE